MPTSLTTEAVCASVATIEAACARCGVRPKSIGVHAIYNGDPALYAHLDIGDYRRLFGAEGEVRNHPGILDFCAERDGVQFRAFTYDTNVAAAAAVPA